MNAVVEHIGTAEVSRSARASAQVIDAVPVLDTARFEHMQRIATVMMRSSLLPESLTTTGTKDEKLRLSDSEIMANAFLVVNQAIRWGLDPFAVAQCVSVVHGRLCYEGKLVAAVLEAKAGIRLAPYFTGQNEGMRVYLVDVPITEALIPLLTPDANIPGVRMITGTVSDWKTTGQNSPWAPKYYRRQLVYRGTRDWCRMFEPALMLGVYTEDEMGSLAENARAERSRPVAATVLSSISDRLAAARSTDASPSTAMSKHVEAEMSDAVEVSDATEAASADPEPDTAGAVTPDPAWASAYSSALMAAASGLDLKAAHVAFFGDADPEDETDRETLVGRIYYAHRMRLVKKTSADDTASEVARIIAEFSPVT